MTLTRRRAILAAATVLALAAGASVVMPAVGHEGDAFSASAASAAGHRPARASVAWRLLYTETVQPGKRNVVDNRPPVYYSATIQIGRA